MMAYPDGLSKQHAQGAQTRGHWNYFPLVLLGTILSLAMLGLFGGGRSQWIKTSAPAAELLIHTPHTLRNGVLFETRIVVRAFRDMDDATIAISAPLWRDMTINTTLPAAEKEEYSNGAMRFHMGPLSAGDRIEFKIDGQVNPPAFAGSRGEVVLLDGKKPVAKLPLVLKVLP